MKREAQCDCCRAEMAFDQGVYLEVIIVHQRLPAPFDLFDDAPPEPDEEGEEGEDTERFVPPTLQQPMARLLCDRCASFLQVDEDTREQARVRAMAWWRDMLPHEAVRLEARPCGLCGGKGNRGRLPCQLCGRSGTIVIRSPARKCATCSGTGKGFLSMHFGVGGTCSFCRGMGWQYDHRADVRQQEDAAKQQRRLDARTGRRRSATDRGPEHERGTASGSL